MVTMLENYDIAVWKIKGKDRKYKIFVSRNSDPLTCAKLGKMGAIYLGTLSMLSTNISYLLDEKNVEAMDKLPKSTWG